VGKTALVQRFVFNKFDKCVLTSLLHPPPPNGVVVVVAHLTPTMGFRPICNHILPRHDSTIGAAFVTKDLLADGVLIKLEMWVREPSRAPARVSCLHRIECVVNGGWALCGWLRWRVRTQDTAGQERYRSLSPLYFRGADACLMVYDVTSSQSFADLEGWFSEFRSMGPPHCSPFHPPACRQDETLIFLSRARSRSRCADGGGGQQDGSADHAPGRSPCPGLVLVVSWRSGCGLTVSGRR
jgi:GTPase SAR1 family protein